MTIYTQRLEKITDFKVQIDDGVIPALCMFENLRVISLEVLGTFTDEQKETDNILKYFWTKRRVPNSLP